MSSSEPSREHSLFRHARVLPSFAVPFVGRPLRTTIGDVEATDLLGWNRSALPSAGLALEMARLFVAKRRPSFDVLWDSPVDVRLTDDWRRALSDTERIRLARFVDHDVTACEAFRHVTLRALKEALAMPVVEVLLLLAKLEALYWVSTPPPAPSAMRLMIGNRELQSGPALALEPDFVREIDQCLGRGWVKGLAEDDLRFPGMDGRGLVDWLRPQLTQSHVSAVVHGACARLLAADRASWKEELEDLAVHAAARAVPGPGTMRAKERWVTMFTNRYGGEQGQTLVVVAEQFDVTRERVRQICDYTLTALLAQPTATPALERVLAAAARIMPLPVGEANVQVARFLGDGCGLQAAIAFASVIGLQSPIRSAEGRARTLQGYVAIDVIEATATPATAWINAAMTHARRDCDFVGCTNFVRVAGLLALHEGQAQDKDTLLALFAKAPGYRVLDPEGGWFTLVDGDQSALATRLKKLLSVAGEEVGIDTIASAFQTDDRWFYRDDRSRGLALPPLHVLTALLGGWHWLRGNAHNVYSAVQSMDRKQHLSSTELKAVETIESLGGAATKKELRQVMTTALGISDMAVSLQLASSPAIVRMDKGIYGVRSDTIAAKALIAARQRRQDEHWAGPGREVADAQLDVAEPFELHVTQARSSKPLKLQVVYLPGYLRGKVEGLFAHAGGKLRSIHVGPNTQIRHLAAAAHGSGVAAGERFRIVFDLARRTYDLPSLPLVPLVPLVPTLPTGHEPLPLPGAA